jgi:hypothetical protein
MTGLRIRSVPIVALLATLAAGVAPHEARAAVTVVVKNDGPSPAQVGFDGGMTRTIVPRATERFFLEAGAHSAQCRYEGSFDGCNLEGSFTLLDTRERTFGLRPFFTAQHAVALAQQAQLTVETRSDQTWATSTRDVAGGGADCADYQVGKLGEVSRRFQGRSQLSNVTLVTQTLCGELRPAFSAQINGTRLYFPVRSVLFRDRAGRLVLVRQ